jgi:hypothetical protein
LPGYLFLMNLVEFICPLILRECSTNSLPFHSEVYSMSVIEKRLSDFGAKKSKPNYSGLPFILYGAGSKDAGYPRLPPLPPCFAPVLRLRVDIFSSLVFKKRDSLSSKFSFDLKLPFDPAFLEWPAPLPWPCGRFE